MTAFLTLIGVLGLVLGSFLNVVIYRLPRGESLVSPGSHCPSCAIAISPYDNVPVVSWVALQGRCRSCSDAISIRYPVVEQLTAVTFVAIAAARGPSSELVLDLPFAALFIAVSGIDLDYRIIPNRALLAGAVWAAVGLPLLIPDAALEHLAAGAAAFTALLLVVLAYPAGMGMGDVKLAGLMGLFLGTAVVPALFVAFAVGAIVGLVHLTRRGVAARKLAIPFAPFLAVGGLLGLIVGPEIVDLYSRSFL